MTIKVPEEHRQFMHYAKEKYGNSGDALQDIRDVLGRVFEIEQNFLSNKILFDRIRETFFFFLSKEEIDSFFRDSQFFLYTDQLFVEELILKMIDALRNVRIRGREGDVEILLFDLGEPDLALRFYPQATIMGPWPFDAVHQIQCR